MALSLIPTAAFAAVEEQEKTRPTDTVKDEPSEELQTGEKILPIKMTGAPNDGETDSSFDDSSTDTNSTTAVPQNAPSFNTDVEAAEKGMVARIGPEGGSDYYTSLDDAIKAIQDKQDKDTVTLVANCEIDAPITVNSSITLNLNGHQITNNVMDDRPFHITGEVTFTVDGAVDGSGMTIPEDNTGAYGFIKVAAPSTVTLNGGTYSGNTDNGAFVKIVHDGSVDASGSTVIYNNVTMTSNGRFFSTDTLLTDASIPTLQVTGGSYTTDGQAFSTDIINASPVTFDGATVTAGTGPCIEVCGPAATFTNCTFTVKGENPNGFGTTAVATSQRGTATINSGTYSAPYGYGAYVYSSGGTIDIVGGTVSGGTAAVRADTNKGSYPTAVAVVYITGGRIEGALQTSNTEDTDIYVSGGTFTQAVPDAYCAPGMKPTTDGEGKYTVTTDTNIFAYGNGTKETPFAIDSVDGLKAFRDSVNTGTTYEGQYIQLAEGTYDLSGGDWTPIGNGTRSGSGYEGKSFQGYFDGNGQTITGLTITGSDTYTGDKAVGLFGVVNGGTVKNLVLSNVNINVPSNECAGGAIGLMVHNATASGIAVSGSVTGAKGVGGIVGRMTVEGTISDCDNSASVTGSGYNVGGIVGAAYYTAKDKSMEITGCGNTGKVVGSSGIGGIVGLSAADVSGCTNTGAVTGSAYSIGGIVGEQKAAGSITGCTNTADITNTNENADGYGTGGIVGWVRYATSDEASSYPKMEIIKVTGNRNDGKTITGSSDAGGIIGTLYNAGVVTGNENTAKSIFGTTFAAGIVGNLQSTETPDGGIPKNDIQVVNNVSTTTLDQIEALHTSPYAYKNQGDEEKVVVDENSTEWVAQIGEQKYTTLQGALDKAQDGAEIQILRNLTLDETLNLSLTGKSITIQGQAGQNITITGGENLNNQKLLTGTVGGLTLKNLTFQNGVVSLNTSGAVVVENCTFENTTSSQGDKSGVLNVYGRGNDASLTVTGSTFQNLKLAAGAAGEEFVGIYTQGGMDAITVQNSVFRSIAGTALSLRDCDDITITGNTFEDWADGSKDGAGRAVRIDFGSRTEKQSLTFTENRLIAGPNAKESYVKIGEIAENNANNVTLNVGKNYWDGKDPTTGTVNSTETPVLEIVIGDEKLTSDELRTNKGITGQDRYYLRPTMNPEDMNDYTPPVNPDGGNSGGSSEPSYSPVIDITGNGDVRVNPRTPSYGDKVTITPNPDNGYEVGEVIVTDRSGDAVRVTANRDGTYTFTQPRGRVTIEVTFVPTGTVAFFTDVTDSFWAYDEIKWAYENGYVNGTTTTTFSPNASISRQQVWMILARLSGAEPANMAAAREWAMVNNISDGTNPGSAVTRQQLVALLYRYAVMMGYANDARADLTTFPDAGTVASYAVEPMQWSVANNIVAGTSAGTLNPTGTATRAQFAVILYRFMA